MVEPILFKFAIIACLLFSSCTFNLKEKKEDEEEIYSQHEYHNEDNVLVGTSTHVNGKRHGQEVGYWDTGKLKSILNIIITSKQVLTSNQNNETINKHININIL
jgi:hypothetical protein